MAPNKSSAARGDVPVAAGVPAGGEFPKMVYGPKGQQKIVPDAEAQKKLGPEWKEAPSA